MISKKDFAEHIIEEFCKSEKMNPKDLTECHILKSSSLAVAMEYLGLIETPELKDYAKNRGGTFILKTNHPNDGSVRILSTREMMDLLPETLKIQTAGVSGTCC